MLVDRLQEDKFGDNIKVIVDYWRAVFVELQHPVLRAWTLDMLKEVNGMLSKNYKLATKNNDIDFACVQRKLDDIAANADAIAENIK